MNTSRPELQAPPESYYNEEEAQKYTDRNRIIQVQTEMTDRCLQLLELQEENCLILDIGCGSGLSGEILTEEGHYWVGLDISRSMLNVAVERECEGELYENDLGQGFNFLPGKFDAAISVSVIQWLCNVDKTGHNAWNRLLKFFTSLFKCLKFGAKIAFQFYPANKEQLEMISNAAIKCGFSGGCVVDYPNSSLAKKYYLVLSTAHQGKMEIKMVDGLQEEESDEEDGNKVKKHRKRKIRKSLKNGKFEKNSKLWVLAKKEKLKKQGVSGITDSKYTGRKRNTKW